MQEEPDFLYKMVDAGFPPGAPDVHHPLMGRLVIFFPLIWGNVPEGERQNQHGEYRIRTSQHKGQCTVIWWFKTANQTKGKFQTNSLLEISHTCT